MSRKTATSIPALPLFPFQAVLCCTMGALILILIVINRHSRAQAMTMAKAAVAKSDQAKGEIAAQRDMLNWQIEQIGVSRKQTEEQLTDRRIRLAGLEEQVRELRARWAALQNTAEMLRKTDAVGERRAATQAELTKLQGELALAEQDLAAMRDKASKAEGSFAIVAYVGPNQTRRRPIYIECRGDRIILQPEGVELLPSDFKGASNPKNPLSQALRAVRERIAELDRTQVEKLGEPYPLLIVRPDGIVAYAIAREAMKDWGADFGYEFVESDWKLKYPPADPQLMQREMVAIEESRIRTRIAAAGGGGQQPRATYRAGYGGIVREGGPEPDDELADNHFGAKSKDHGGSGDVLGAPTIAKPAGYNSGGGMYAGGGGGNSTGGTAGSGTAGGIRGGMSGTGPGGTGAGGMGTSGGNSAFAAGGGTGPNGTGTGGGNSPFAGNGGTGPGGTGGAGNGGLGLGGAGGNANGNGLTGAGGNTNGSGLNGAGGGGGNSLDGGPALGGPGGTTGGTSGAGPGGNALAGDDGLTPRGSVDPLNPYGVSGASTADTTGGATAGGIPAGPRDGGATGSSSSGSAGKKDPYAFTHDPQSGGNRKTAGGADGDSMPSGTSVDYLMNGNVNDADKQEERSKRHVRSLAESRGANWGITGPTIKQVAVTRPVRIQCSGDKLVILADNGQSVLKTIAFQNRTEDAIDDLVLAVREIVKTWGTAGRNMYWRPQLVLEIGPSGEGRFYELQALLQNSGLDVVRKGS